MYSLYTLHAMIGIDIYKGNNQSIHKYIQYMQNNKVVKMYVLIS